MNNKKLFNKKFFMIAVVVVLVMVAGLTLTGYLAVIWKQPQQQVVLITRVCGDDVVATYNKVSQYTQNGDTSSLDETGLKNLVTEVKSKAHYQDDATCQMILLAAAIHYQDYNSAKTAYDVVTALHAKHVYVDSNLNTGGSLSQYGTYVQELAPANNNASTQEPKGGA